MKIIVDHIYGPVVKKMHDAGWKVYDDPESGEDREDRNWTRRICGLEMLNK